MSAEMHVRRSATKRAPNASSESKPLQEWRDLEAYVLLGEPGSGKTTAFQREALEMGSAAMYITSRDLFALKRPRAWMGEVLFIDALDERRKVSSAPTEALDELRGILNALGSPRFRLSCREADWPATGLEDLAKVSPSGDVHALWLEPLSESDTTTLLDHRLGQGEAGTHTFLVEAERRRLGFMLSNPLLLHLLVDAVNKNTWPDDRRSTYELSCSRMAQEHDRQRLGSTIPVAVDKLLDVAGLIHAVFLLSDARAISLDPLATGESAIAVHELERLDLDPSTLRYVLDSKLFIADGTEREPRHRTIAEYLAARSIARLVGTAGLPIARVLALVAGADGRAVDVLRGLHAWLSVHCLEERRGCIGRDPLGAVHYGDVQQFSVSDKVAILEALKREAQCYRWFRAQDRDATAFGALGTPDMQPTFASWLGSPSRDAEHQVVLGCIFDAIENGGPFVGLQAGLERIVRDPTYWDHVRSSALRAWLKNAPANASDARSLLRDVAKGNVLDADDELAGELLAGLYPNHLSVEEVLGQLRPSKRDNWFGSYKNFWNLGFLPATPKRCLPHVADLLADRCTASTLGKDDEDDEPVIKSVQELAVHAVRLALENSDIDFTAERLGAWLAAGFDRYGNMHVATRHADAIGTWLTKRPDAMKRVYHLALQRCAQSSARDGRSYWQAEQFLYHAELPADWYLWLLDVASQTPEIELARFCVLSATQAALSDESIGIEQVESWVTAHEHRWPHADAWKLEMAFSPLDHWKAKEYRHKQRHDAKRKSEHEARRRWISPHWDKIRAGTASPGLYKDIAFAYQKRFSDIHGSTPVERVADYLCADPVLAGEALEGLKLVLHREDLPTVDAIFAQTDKRFYLSYAALLAADLACEEDGAVCESWTNRLRSTLLAFLLKDTHGSIPAWYETLAVAHPDVVAPLFLKFHVPELQGSAHPKTAFLRHLSDDPALKPLAEAVLEPLMRSIPRAPTDELLHLLNGTLVPACACHLSADVFKQLIKECLAWPDTSVALRATLHVASMRFDPESAVAEIETTCAAHADAASMVSRAVKGQGLVNRATSTKSPAAVGRLAQILASSAAPPDADDLSYLFGDAVHGVAVWLIRLLGSSPDSSAGEELRRLRGLPSLSHWSVEVDAQLFQHESVARKAGFEAPRADAVITALLNLSPANARDMAELVRAHLSRLANEIQFTESNLRDHFYRDLPTARRSGRSVADKPQPKIENGCRDILLGLIRDRLLRQGVQIEKESYAAGDKRGDLRVSAVIGSRRVVVPIEVKKDDHPALWVAWREQLERQYMSDPDTQGIGMYVVLWFGVGTRAAPDGTKPRSASHVAEMLTSMIPDERRARIVGLVVDLSLGLR